MRDVAVELFGLNWRQPLGKGSMQIHARLGARREGGEGGSRTVMEGTLRYAIGVRGYRRYARTRKPWRCLKSIASEGEVGSAVGRRRF